jgi:hypothetical protein
MLHAELPPVRANLEEVRYFQSVAIAAHKAIELNHIMPRDGGTPTQVLTDRR